MSVCSVPAWVPTQPHIIGFCFSLGSLVLPVKLLEPISCCLLIHSELEAGLYNVYWHGNAYADVWCPPHCAFLCLDYSQSKSVCLCDVFWETESRTVTVKRHLRVFLAWSPCFLLASLISQELYLRVEACTPHLKELYLKIGSVLFQMVMFIWESHQKAFPKDIEYVFKTGFCDHLSLGNWSEPS